MLVGLFAGTAVCAEGVLARYSLGASAHTQWALPSRLLEVSALTMTTDARLLAVDDEKAVVYELDYARGGLVKAFALGEPTLRGDFEGLAIDGESVYLMTSDGDLFVAREGGDGKRVEYRRIPTGLKNECEFEGLAYDSRNTALLLLCKDVDKGASIDGLAIFVWDTRRREIRREATVLLPVREIFPALRVRSLHPSGIAIDPASGHRLIVAARERALVELAADGSFVAARRLPLAARHPQAEGIELSPDGALLVADEGGNSRARLSVYAADRNPAQPVAGLPGAGTAQP